MKNKTEYRVYISLLIKIHPVISELWHIITGNPRIINQQKFHNKERYNQKKIKDKKIELSKLIKVSIKQVVPEYVTK